MSKAKQLPGVHRYTLQFKLNLVKLGSMSGIGWRALFETEKGNEAVPPQGMGWRNGCFEDAFSQNEQAMPKARRLHVLAASCWSLLYLSARCPAAPRLRLMPKSSIEEPVTR